jgi:glycosyltransferase involved in cell wall biosynthesis
MILETAPLLPSYQFIIAGPSDPSIRGIDFQSLPANVQIIEKEFSDDEKADLFYNCHVFLAPYVEEDFGITPIEANAYGKPVVYCDDSGELVHTQKHMKTGFMCKRKPEDIAAGIEYCVRNASGMSPACVDNATKYSWSSFEKAFRKYVKDHIISNERFSLA